MLRIALASVAAGVMAFAAVAFWPSAGPSRTVSISVATTASTDTGAGGIGDLLQGSRAGEEESTGEVQLSSLKDQESLSFEPPGEEAEASGYDDGSATEGEAAPEGSDELNGDIELDSPSSDEDNPTASFDDVDQALIGPDGVQHPRLPVRKPKRSAKAEPPPTNFSLVERVAEIGPGAIARLEEKFSDAGVAWPPQRLAFLAFKEERVIEVQAQSAGGGWAPVYRYKVEAASGGSGPKLVQGDKQVPEGLYKIVSLNPNSRYHVSLRVGYPNDFDRAMAKADGRKNLGGDIMIHGKNLSAGCLAVGDQGAEEFFVMAHALGLDNVDVIIAPRDFRKPSAFSSFKETINFGGPSWLPSLYDTLKTALEPFPEMPPSVTPNIAQK